MPTLKDIAIRAKVDPSTVSRVLNGAAEARIHPRTRSRILSIASDLDYRGNFQARSLRRGKTGMVGLLIPETYDPILSQYQHLLEDGLRQRSLEPFVVRVGWSPDREQHQIDLLRRGMVDGLIVLSAKQSLIATYRDLREKGIALMLRVPHMRGFEGFDGCLHIDIAEGFRRLAEHMIDGGCRRVGVLGGRVAMELAAGTEHRAAAVAFNEALRQRGLTPDPTLGFPVTQTVEDHKPMSDQIAAWLSGVPGGIDGLIVTNHRELLAVWRAIRLAGLRVPRDLKLASLGDSDITRLWEPPITVWDLPIAETCKALIVGLLRQLASSDDAPDAVSTRGHLIARETTAA